ncbi:MAG TPA: iron-containing alcohol dehydrogenase, partial [Desulfosarcina sp.]|nr:iron-containing alcohol dehydrogenase [Desulfosarcina sp.]
MCRDVKIPVVDPALFAGKCSCGGSHPAPDIRLYSGEDVWEVLAADARSVLNSQPVMVMADQNTYPAAGAAVTAALQAASVSVALHILPGDIHLTEELARKVIARTKGISLVIAVGAGTINDLGKYTAQHLGIPYWTVPTAPSMNGYTSSIAAIKKDGVKRTLPSAPPRIVYAHPRVIRNAPLKLTQAGYCDVMAKSVSDIDWQIESTLFGGAYCTLPSAIMVDAEPLYANRPEQIAAGDAAAVDALFRGLLVSGMAMTLAGSSAPASGGEHLVSHFWDMREDLTGRVPELHGLQVGAGILLSAACYEKLR